MVVELAADAASFLFLRVNEPAGQFFERQFGLFALCDVAGPLEDEGAALRIAYQHLAAFDDQLTAVPSGVRQFATPLTITLQCGFEERELHRVLRLKQLVYRPPSCLGPRVAIELFRSTVPVNNRPRKLPHQNRV